MFHTTFRDIDFEHVEAFCQTWSEGVRVEYKQEPVQISKIISSFANTFGGIWIIGVETDRATNRPLLPIRGMPVQPGIEEQITQACWTSIYPPLTPEIKVIPLPSAPNRVVTVVKMPESVEAPHAIENTARVYIRTNSVTQPIQLAEIDRIAYLLERRRAPEQRREQMIKIAVERADIPSPCIRIMIGPKYPYQPLFSRDELARRLEELRDRLVIPWTMRRIQQGLLALHGPVAHTPLQSERFEVNTYGLICYAKSLDPSFGPSEITYHIGRLLRMAAYVLHETTTNLLLQVRLEGVKDHEFRSSEIIPSALSEPYQALDETIEAETDALLETLLQKFTAHVTDLVLQIMWAFNWANEYEITSRSTALLQTQWPKL